MLALIGLYLPPNMRKNILIIGLIIMGAVACKNKKQPGVVQFKMMHVPAYCGGAEPDEEMKKSMSKPRPFTGVIYVYDNPSRDGDPVVIQLDEKGKYTFQALSEGDYFYSRHKMLSLDEMAADPKKQMCQEEWYNLEQRSFTVGPGTKAVTDTVNFSCDPCALPMP